MTVAPGTWHDSEPMKKVAWHVAVAAWVEAAQPVLEKVAATYGASITYDQLAEQLFDTTGYRTRMMLGQWIGKVLGPVQAATLTGGKPPLSALVVRKGTGGVGEGYVNHEHPGGFASFAERQHAAAVDRLTCYRAYCEDVPADAAPQMTSLYLAKQSFSAGAQRTTLQKSAAAPQPPRRPCPIHGMALPAGGRCDYC
ncbi:hypothetical protein [Blastococcus sp. SYSU D01042]